MIPKINIVLLAAWSLSAVAGPLRGTCPDWSPAERAIEAACDRNADCARIADHYATCAKIRAWVSAVAPADGKTVVSFDVERALARARNPKLVESEASVRAKDCLGATYAWKSCRVFLGIDGPQPEDRVADLDPALPAERAAVSALLNFGLPVMRDLRAAGRGEAYDALAACEAARDNPQRAEVCRKAQEAYERCTQGQDDWNARRTALLAQLDARRPDLGRSCHIPGREMDPANTGSALANEWNCSVSALRSLKLPGCPGFLPSSWQTPIQALAAWDQEDRAKGRNGVPGQDVASAKGGTGFTSNLFQQSAAQASQQVNDPQAAARVAADNKMREAEMNQLIAAGERRQQAILGTMVGQVTQGMQATARGQGPSTTAGALGSTYTNLQQSASAGGGSLAQMPTVDQMRRGLMGAPTSGTGDAGMPASEAAPVPSTGAPPYGGDCKTGQERLTSEINGINARRPANANTIASLQTVMYIAQRGINQLSGAQCVNDPQASAELDSLRKAFNGAMNNCRQLASNVSLCGPQLNW